MCLFDPKSDARPLSRRAALAAAASAAGAAALAAAPAAALAAAPHAPNPAPDSPRAALAALMAGNARFVAGTAMAPNRNIERLRQLRDTQKPFAAFLGCADSRVPIEIVFDQGFGDVFPVRVAGNIVTSEITGSLEYACEVLGSQVLFVLGHESCGAVAATMKGAPVPGLIGSLYQHIAPAVEAAGPDLHNAIIANVRFQVGLLRRSPVLAERERSGKLLITGGVYDFASGRVTLVEDRAPARPAAGRG